MAKRKKTPKQKAKKKVVDEFMKSYRGKPCAVCGTTYGTCAHHLLTKGAVPRHVVTPENIMVLCSQHHTFSSKLSAHNGSIFAVIAFKEWLQEKHPEKWRWMNEHKHDSASNCGKIDWLTLGS